MAMTEDTDIWFVRIQPSSRVVCQLSFLIQHMAHGNRFAVPTDHDLSRKSASLVLVDIAGHGYHRCKTFERLDYPSIADVSCVHYRGHADKMSFDRGIIEPVSIGNDPDANGPTLLHGVATGWTPSESCTFFQSNVNGSGIIFGKDANSALSSSARAVLIG